MSDQDPIEELVRELSSFAQLAASEKAGLRSADLGRVLSFLVKITQVAEQAFQDVYVVLVDIKYLTPDRLGDLSALRKQVDLLTARSKFRDVEEICSRLHHLSDFYREQIDPLLSDVVDKESWSSLFGLLDEHEGRLIMLVYQMSGELKSRLSGLNEASLGKTIAYAERRGNELRASIDRLRDVTNRILGLSGQAGLLELIERGDGSGNQARIFLERGALQMSRDTYKVGQAAAVGPNATAHDVSMQQVWTQNKGSIDLAELARQLKQLRSALRSEASEPEHDVAVAAVAEAETAAKNGDGPTALAKLRQAGEWAFDVATKIGITVAAAALKTALGL